MLQTSSIQGVFRVDFCSVVTNVVNLRAFSLIMVVFWLGLTTFVTGVLVRRFESCWFDDVCNVGCPLVAWPGPAAVHGHRSQTLSARWPDCLKPSSPLLAGICVGLKPPSPLRGRNGCFGAFFGRRGVVGFSVPLLGVSSGVGGFNVAALSRLVREKVRPAWPDGGREREKVRPAHEKWPKIGVFTLVGRTFSRKGRRRGGVGRVLSRTGSRGIPRGELCCAVALVVSPSTGSVNPSIRSYTHLVEAGRGRPTRPQQPTPKRKALIKGSGPPVKAVTSLDNGRKWRVYAGRTLELLR